MKKNTMTAISKRIRSGETRFSLGAYWYEADVNGIIRRREQQLVARQQVEALHKVQYLFHSSSYRLSSVPKVVYSGIQRSSTLPVSPWRFLATMHSAMLCFSESSL